MKARAIAQEGMVRSSGLSASRTRSSSERYSASDSETRNGAPGPTRTGTSSRKTDFESVASTNSATGAAYRLRRTYGLPALGPSIGDGDRRSLIQPVNPSLTLLCDQLVQHLGWQPVTSTRCPRQLIPEGLEVGPAIAARLAAQWTGHNTGHTGTAWPRNQGLADNGALPRRRCVACG